MLVSLSRASRGTVFGVIGFLDRRKLCGMRSVGVALVSQEPIAGLEQERWREAAQQGLQRWG